MLKYTELAKHYKHKKEEIVITRDLNQERFISLILQPLNVVTWQLKTKINSLLRNFYSQPKLPQHHVNNHIMFDVPIDCLRAFGFSSWQNFRHNYTKCFKISEFKDNL